MSLETIHLRKLLTLLYLTPNRQVSALRADIRQDIARDNGASTGGGDFYGPFWRDARDHVFNLADLYDSVEERIESNPGRERLYPRLRDGFLHWWNERRRWTNEPFQRVEAPHGKLEIRGLGTIKAENLLAVRDGIGVTHSIYPYFSEAPVLTDEAARLGLWVLSQALPEYPLDDIRILDVIRGETFSASADRNPFRGDERDVLIRRYSDLVELRRELLREY